MAEKGSYHLVKNVMDSENLYVDFTKQYNRLRQHNAISQGKVSSDSTHAVLPAINRPKPARTAKTDSPERKAQVDKRLTDQLTRLSKLASKIANIDEPYAKSTTNVDSISGFQLGVSVNRKGPSASANQKDRADRATTEQVLDPRTRIILFKMIGRGVIKEINGCISTGKEVRSSSVMGCCFC
jgi:RIO kinase 1